MISRERYNTEMYDYEIKMIKPRSGKLRKKMREKRLLQDKNRKEKQQKSS